ncbi:hypothetical protein [Thomasclavelia spiroformis]|uniref:hypothetical protein n=1 Tax=Thomasclavelia spiroformis TaxID=29348 RepID=UPI0039903D70
MLKQDKLSSKEKKIVYDGYHLLIDEYVELEAQYKYLKDEYKELQEMIEIKDLKLLN